MLGPGSGRGAVSGGDVRHKRIHQELGIRTLPSVKRYLQAEAARRHALRLAYLEHFDDKVNPVIELLPGSATELAPTSTV